MLRAFVKNLQEKCPEFFDRSVSASLTPGRCSGGKSGASVSAKPCRGRRSFVFALISDTECRAPPRRPGHCSHARDRRTHNAI